MQWLWECHLIHVIHWHVAFHSSNLVWSVCRIVSLQLWDGEKFLNTLPLSWMGIGGGRGLWGSIPRKDTIPVLRLLKMYHSRSFPFSFFCVMCFKTSPTFVAKSNVEYRFWRLVYVQVWKLSVYTHFRSRTLSGASTRSTSLWILRNPIWHNSHRMGNTRTTPSDHSDLLDHYQASVRILGQAELLKPDLLAQFKEIQEMTQNNKNAILNVCCPYTSREEITHSLREICIQVENGELEVETIDEAVIERNLYTQDCPPPDLLIRTSGVQRLSDFLLWQV